MKKNPQTVTFTITPEDLKFYNQELEYKNEPGEFEVRFRISFSRFLGFFWGVALARLLAVEAGRRALAALPSWTWAVGLGLLLYCRWLWGSGWFMAAGGNEHLKNLLFFSAVNASLFLVTASVMTRASILSRIFSFTPLRFLGIISYSLFMTHMLALQITQNLVGIPVGTRS